MSKTQMSERDVRITKIHAMRAMGIHPYAQKFDKQHMLGDICKQHPHILTGENPFRDIKTIIQNPEKNVKTA